MKTTKSKLLIGIITIIFICVCLISCDYSQCTYKWKLKIIYTNGDIDTLDYKYTFCGRPLCVDNELLHLYTDEGKTCLYVTTGVGVHATITCDVRRYEVLSLNKNNK